MYPTHGACHFGGKAEPNANNVCIQSVSTTMVQSSKRYGSHQNKTRIPFRNFDLVPH